MSGGTHGESAVEDAEQDRGDGAVRSNVGTAVEGNGGIPGDVQRGATERLVFFSDAVVAIAITLLAIELPVPTGESAAEFLTSLRAESFAYVTFLISFLVIGSHWSAHHRVFRYLGTTDRRLISLNLAWLLLIVITPYLTKVIREGDANIARFGVYAIAQGLLMIVFAVMVHHMGRRGLFVRGTPRWLTTRGWARSLSIAAGFLISVPLYLVIGQWAFALWALAPMAFSRIAVWSGLIPRDDP